MVSFGKEARIITLLIIDVVFFLVEIIVGYSVGSLALVADSFHMLNDVMSLIVALYALRLSTREHTKDARYSYGWQRAEILGALVNGVFLLALCFSIFMEAIERAVNITEVSNPRLVVIVGSFGLASNIVGLFLFHDHGHSHGGHSHSHAPAKAPPSPRAEGDVAPAPSESSGSTAVQTRHREDSVTSLYGHPAQTRAYVVKAAQDLGYERDEHARLSGTPAAGYGATEAHDHAGHSHDVEAATPAHSHAEHGHDHSGDGHGHSHGSMNMRGVFLHVLGDALGNVGVIASGLFILETTYWWRFYSDPAISFLITIIIFSSALPLVKSASFILLQGVPPSVPLEEVREMLVQTDGVISIHELHVWQLSESTIIASMHVLVDCGPGQDERYMHIAQRLRNVLHSFGVHAATIQPEFVRGGLKTAARISGVDVAPEETDEHGRLITPAGKLVEAELLQNETACLISCGPEGSSCAGDSCCPPPKGTGATLTAGSSSPAASGSASRPRSTHSNHDGHAH